jgi:hypothetical protein
MTITRSIGRAATAAALVLLSVSPAAAQWTPAGTLAVPPHHYSFLACTPQGDLLAATNNSTNAPMELPAILIRNPTSSAPQVVELCTTRFEGQRGYGGLAADPSGSFFVSGDTGARDTSFVRKFSAEGAPDGRFGNGGEIRPNRRCLGMDVLGTFLLLAVDWGEILVFDTATGRPLWTVPDADSRTFMRDISIDPKSLRIFGVAQGGVLMWGGGAPWAPQTYRYAQFSQPAGEPRSGEGISIDPILRCLLVTPVPGNTLFEVFGNRTIRRTTVTTARPDSHLCDSALSFEGTTLFISDMRARQIHVLTRPFPQSTAPPPPAGSATGTVTDSGAPTAPPVQWNRDYTAALQTARQQGKPMIVYFRRPGMKACEDFEKNVLLTNEFNRRAQPFINVFEDAVANRLLAYRLGVFRVPHLVILDRNGETKAEFSFNIDPGQLFAAIEANTP